MTCASCVNAVEECLRQLDGVAEAGVNLLSGTGVVQWRAPASTQQVIDLLKAVDGMGFPCNLDADDGGRSKLKERRAHEVRSLRDAFLLAVLLTIPVFLLNMVLPRTGAKHDVMHEPGERVVILW